MNEFIEGLLLGLGVCVPFGPINILIISYAVKSFKNAYSLGLGACTGDFLYLVFLHYGILGFIKNETFLDVLSIFGCLFLSYMGFCMVKAGTSKLEIKEKIMKDSIIINYFKGLAINMSNPYVITFWLSVATILDTSSNPLFLFLGLMICIFSWIFCLAFFVYKYTHLFSAKVLKGINIFSGIILGYFAVMLILKRFYGF
ncbi:LysE family transporter [Campylobacter sp. MG1]|uniref:LysE family transporter n=1 Tax=Campylobacter sp. MG1 TaxID=2976332 RepID=UPI00226CFFFA|nr:LysE family transporter [Campylobacter sp. MG1]